MSNLISAERLRHAWGTRVLLDGVSLGLGRGDVVGVVGRNGDGKTTLLRILTGELQPDSGRVTRSGAVSVGYLHQAETSPPGTTVRDVIVGGRPDHVWAADGSRRALVSDLLSGLDLDAAMANLSGGERRRVGLVALMLGEHDLLVLDEPTNHLDVEAVAWLADHLAGLRDRGLAMLVVSHDRWFLDAVCTRIWEVHDAEVDAYDGGYAAYVLARAERARQAAGMAARRRNLLRKELAWLRRGAPARTSKPKFRLDAASALIADEPPPRDRLELQRFAVARLGKDVVDLQRVTVRAGARTLLEAVDYSLGPGDRIGVVGVNGAGKTTLLRLLAGEAAPDAGRVKQGKTLRLAHLTQEAVLPEDEADDRVLDAVERIRLVTRLADGAEAGATALLEDFGFSGGKLLTRLRELSGGERRRLQFLRLLLGEPNVLLLDEPTNDLDIDTLTVLEDYLDSWPGTLVVVSHDRYFLERVCDVTWALLGDGRFALLPGGVEEYLARRRAARGSAEGGPAGPVPGADGIAPVSDAARTRQARKDLARLEARLAKQERRLAALHLEMADAAADYVRLAALQGELDRLTAERDEVEEAWLEAAERAD